MSEGRGKEARVSVPEVREEGNLRERDEFLVAEGTTQNGEIDRQTNR